MRRFIVAATTLAIAATLVTVLVTAPATAVAGPNAPTAIVEPLATGPGCIVQSDFRAPGSDHGNFEVVVLQGSDLVHYWHDNADPTLAWHRGETITTAATGPGCIIQSDFRSPGSNHGNFEVVVPEGNTLVHYFHDNADPTLPWQRGQT